MSAVLQAIGERLTHAKADAEWDIDRDRISIRRRDWEAICHLTGAGLIGSQPAEESTDARP